MSKHTSWKSKTTGGKVKAILKCGIVCLLTVATIVLVTHILLNKCANNITTTPGDNLGGFPYSNTGDSGTQNNSGDEEKKIEENGDNSSNSEYGEGQTNDRDNNFKGHEK